MGWRTGYRSRDHSSVTAPARHPWINFVPKPHCANRINGAGTKIMHFQQNRHTQVAGSWSLIVTRETGFMKRIQTCHEGDEWDWCGVRNTRHTRPVDRLRTHPKREGRFAGKQISNFRQPVTLPLVSEMPLVAKDALRFNRRIPS